MEGNANKKLPNGFCTQIAQIVGTDRFYVSKILRNPENHNGPLAEKVKQTAHQLTENVNSIRAAFNGTAV